MSYKYEVIIFWSKADRRFIAEVPELAGCMADGKSCEEAAANAQQIIAEWLETAKDQGRNIPKPKNHLASA